MAKKELKYYPSISVVIPTFNAGETLKDCLRRVKEQDYPDNRVEIIIVDGFSTDETRTIAKSFGCRLIDNPLVVHPRGRSLGIDQSNKDLILCLDSDNLIVGKDWLRRMVEPFDDDGIFASEPLFYSADPQDSIITKYCSLIGGDDPIIIYLGYYERFSYLTGHWTGVPIKQEDKGGYLDISFLDNKKIPSLGANGFMVRRSILKQVGYRPFYHMDIVFKILEVTSGRFAKVKVGVIHRHSASFKKFILKKYRRVARRLDKKANIQYYYQIDIVKLLSLCFKCFFILPLFMDGWRANKRCPSKVWLWHPLITVSVFYLYFLATLKNKILVLIGRANIKNNSYEKI